VAELDISRSLGAIHDWLNRAAILMRQRILHRQQMDLSDRARKQVK
jgi:hypothetical protein